MRTLLISVLFAACASAANQKEATSNPKKEPATKAAGDPKEISADVKQKICASEFAGGMAVIGVWRDLKGDIALLVLQPDISRFSHAPWTYYNPQGELLLTVPERPMTKEERAKDPVILQMESLKKNLEPDKRSVYCE